MSARYADVLKAWNAIPRKIRRSVQDVSPRRLGWRENAEEWSMREYAHHLIEANLIAATIVIAAIGKPGAVYDWSWVTPSGGWVTRMGYNRVSLDRGLLLLEQLCRYVTSVVRAAPRGLASTVRLRDERSGSLERKSVEQVLRDECEHARHHLRDMARIRHVLRTTRA